MKKKRFINFIVAAAGVAVGGLIAYYGFELVSIPGHREHNEGAYVLVGMVLAVAGLLFAVFKDNRE